MEGKNNADEADDRDGSLCNPVAGHGVALRGRWPGREIKEIQAEFSRIPESFLQDFYRKCFLGDKKAYRDFTATLQPLYLAAAAANRNLLQHGLDYLGGFTIPRQLPDIPIRVVHGRQDIIAPLNEMPDLAGAEVEVVENAGHAERVHIAIGLD